MGKKEFTGLLETITEEAGIDKRGEENLKELLGKILNGIKQLRNYGEKVKDKRDERPNITKLRLTLL